jgi:hypothetical protein
MRHAPFVRYYFDELPANVSITDYSAGEVNNLEYSSISLFNFPFSKNYTHSIPSGE